MSSSIAVSTAGSSTRPFGRRATTRSKRATAGMPAVVPATRISCGGGARSQAAACAFSSATWRAAGFIRPFSARQAGQACGDDAQELQRLRPVRGVGGVGGVRQGGGEVDFLAFRLVHQQGEFAGQEPGTVGGARGTLGAVLGQQDQPGERGEPLGRLDGGRQVERAGERQRCLVQGAQGGDAGEQERFSPGGAQEGLGEGARGAAGGQQDQAVRALEGIGGALQPLGRDGVEQGDVRREGEEVHGVGWGIVFAVRMIHGRGVEAKARWGRGAGGSVGGVGLEAEQA